MITDADIKKMKEVFLTKDDAKAFATKEDLKSFATKDDLKLLATKEDLKLLSDKFETKFATKEDFNDSSKRFDSMDKRIDALANSQQKNTEELVELITSGFKLNEERFDRLETEVFKAN